MPPKKRGAKATATVAAKVPKKTKAEPEPIEEEPETSIIEKLKEADKKDNKVRKYVPDKSIWNANQLKVFKDYDCTLNQTNIGANNNKYYIIQLLQPLNNDSQFQLFVRYGRVGEPGVKDTKYFDNEATAVKEFEKKFKDKTANKWEDREKFVPKTKKYTLIIMDAGGEEEEEIVETTTGEQTSMMPSKLDKATQDLVDLLFDKDMFNTALKKYDIDVKKMPLGKLSKLQISKGFEVLEEIEEVIKKKGTYAKIAELSSKFYTVIPQDFGRRTPTPIQNQELLQAKYDMLVVLSDIELAQSMKDEKIVREETEIKKVPNYLDVNYNKLKCKLELLDQKSDEFTIIKKYKDATKGYRQCQILDVWKVEREDEEKRFAEHDALENRKLLWHGTSVAVVVAILKSGLRIMPHSGGRVGRGIYFASENGKSAGYTGTTHHKKQNVGIMFLNEVVLGKENHILSDDSSLKKAPNGYDCVIADGQTEPDPKEDTELTIDNKKVVVPQGKPKSRNIASSFSQSEYLIYKESQNRIRYMLKMKF